MSLSLERLEDRLLLAGDVKATLSGGTLTIIGDADDNNIAISGVDGDVTVASSDGSETTVNGGDFDTFEGVTKVVIKMKDGDDDVVFGDGAAYDILGSVKIDMGKGDDLLEFGGEGLDPARIRGDLQIKMGSGNDELYSENTTYDGKVKVDLGSGSDFVGMGAGGANTFNDDVKVKMGGGDDEWISIGNIFNGKLKLTGNGGFDVFDDDGVPNEFAVEPKLKVEEVLSGPPII